MDKFIKNLEFLNENPGFITRKLNKMSRVLSSHIQGIKSVEKDIENDSPENLKKHVHAMMITTAAIAEDVYILNLINMIYLNSRSFSEESLSSISELPEIVKDTQESDHIEVAEKPVEDPTPVKEQVEDIEEKDIHAKDEGNKPEEQMVKIQVVEESISTTSEEPVKKRRGRPRKKNQK